jgi:hypothetical protein
MGPPHSAYDKKRRQLLSKPHQMGLRLHTRRLHSVQRNLIQNPKRKRRISYRATKWEVLLKICRLQGRSVGSRVFGLFASSCQTRLLFETGPEGPELEDFKKSRSNGLAAIIVATDEMTSDLSILTSSGLDSIVA